jgi:hypothetical protein
VRTFKIICPAGSTATGPLTSRILGHAEIASVTGGPGEIAENHKTDAGLSVSRRPDLFGQSGIRPNWALKIPSESIDTSLN